MAFKEAITWFGALDHATGCRVDAETVLMRAKAPCVRASLTPHRVASSTLAAHTQREWRPVLRVSPAAATGAPGEQKHLPHMHTPRQEETALSGAFVTRFDERI